MRLAPNDGHNLVDGADDPHTVSPDKIKDIKIVNTVVGGETKYQS